MAELQGRRGLGAETLSDFLRREDPPFRDNAGDELSRRHVEGRVVHGHT